MIIIPEKEKKTEEKKTEKKKKVICPHCGKDINAPVEKKKTEKKDSQSKTADVEMVLEYLRKQVSAKVDSDVADWSLDRLLGAQEIIDKIKPEIKLADPPESKTDSDSDIPKWARVRKGTIIGDK